MIWSCVLFAEQLQKSMFLPLKTNLLLFCKYIHKNLRETCDDMENAA